MAKAWMKEMFPPSRVPWKRIRGKMLPVYYVGRYTDKAGKKYKVYSSKVNDLSSWALLEPVGRGRSRFVYDAGGGFRRTLRSNKYNPRKHRAPYGRRGRKIAYRRRR